MLKHISIQKYVLINFILLLLIVSSLLLSLQYYSNKQLALEAVDKNFHQTASSLSLLLKSNIKSTENIINMLSLNRELLHPIDGKSIHPILDDFVHIMKTRKKIKSIYIAYKNDDFFEVFNVDNNPFFGKKYSLPVVTKWVIKQQQNIQFLDKNLHLLITKKIKKNFKPSSRMWFKQAMQKKSVIKTDVYKFQSTSSYGLTYAKRIPNSDTVVAMDYALSDIGDYLNQQNFDESGNIILYQNDGEMIASSKSLALKDWKKLYQFFQHKNQKEMKKIMYNESEYFTHHSDAKTYEDIKMNIGIVLPVDTLLNPYIVKIIYGVYVALAFIVLAIPLILYSTSLIVKPVHFLMQENEKILKREFANVSEIDTKITEFHQLSNSLVSMSKSIQKYQRKQEKLLDSIVQLIADAIDAKSTYTGGHCERVPKIAEALTHYVSDKKEGLFKDFALVTPDEWREFHIGAWLHDCGKVTTPEYVVDKSTKLETIYNRIHEIRTRFEVLFRDAQISYLESQLKGKDKETALQILHQTQSKLIEDFNFLASSNEGGEFMSLEKQERVKEIAKQTWTRNFNDKIGISADEMHRYEDTLINKPPVREQLLSDKQEHIVKRENFNYEQYKADGFKEEVPEHLYNYGEVYNLCISKGTLSDEERFKINEHVIMSIKMLEELPFPPELKKIPEYAGTHHETMIGTGYPRKLTKEQLSVPARIMAIADIFEALTASDRPYKKAKTLSESLRIMSLMVKDKHIDGDLFDLFLESGIYLKYAQEHLTPEQIDAVDIRILTS